MSRVAIALIAFLLAAFKPAGASEPELRTEILPLIPHAGLINAFAYSPDGRYMISASNDYTLKLWLTSSQQLLRTFYGHTGPVRSVAFAPDGKRVVSGSNDRT